MFCHFLERNEVVFRLSPLKIFFVAKAEFFEKIYSLKIRKGRVVFMVYKGYLNTFVYPFSNNCYSCSDGYRDEKPYSGKINKNLFVPISLSKKLEVRG